MGTQAVPQASKDNESSQKQRHKNTLLDETRRRMMVGITQTLMWSQPLPTEARSHGQRAMSWLISRQGESGACCDIILHSHRFSQGKTELQELIMFYFTHIYNSLGDTRTVLPWAQSPSPIFQGVVPQHNADLISPILVSIVSTKIAHFWIISIRNLLFQGKG